MILGLTPLGVFHTAISLVAVGAGLVGLVRDYEISPRRLSGRIYVVTTVISCLTGFGIFQHGGFGKPHALGIITLIVLGVAAVARRTHRFGRMSPYVATISYSATFFFHMIPGITETATRLPLGAPLVAGAESPELKPVVGAVFALFLIGAALQAWRLRARERNETANRQPMRAG